MIEVKLARVSGLSLEKAKKLPLLRAEDLARADRYLRDTDKVLHLVSAYFKRKYVGEWTATESGKPVSKNVFFSVSHTDGAALLVLADRPVGIDVERIRPADEGTRAFVLSEKEFAAIRTDKDFFKVWTAKESLVKAEGSGFDRDPKDVPSLPFRGAKDYKNETYYSVQTVVGDLVISVTRAGAKPFEWRIEEEIL